MFQHLQLLQEVDGKVYQNIGDKVKGSRKLYPSWQISYVMKKNSSEITNKYFDDDMNHIFNVKNTAEHQIKVSNNNLKNTLSSAEIKESLRVCDRVIKLFSKDISPTNKI